MTEKEFKENVINSVLEKRPVYSKEEVVKEFNKESKWIMSFYDDVEKGYIDNYADAVDMAALNFSMLILCEEISLFKTPLSSMDRIDGFEPSDECSTHSEEAIYDCHR